LERGLKPLSNGCLGIIIKINLTTNYQLLLNCNKVHRALQANAGAIVTHLGGVALGHLGIIVSVATYAVVAPSHPWANPAAPRWGPEVIAADTAAHISAARHLWE
jgi:hypothetical protein